MKEYVRAYVIDNYDFLIYEKDICITRKDIQDTIDFHVIGSQIRFVNNKPYKIICEACFESNYIYYPSTITEGNNPDILGSIIVTGIDEYGDSVSLSTEDIRTLEEYTSLRYYKKNDQIKMIYTLEVDNPNKTNIQTSDPKTIQHLRRAL